MGRGSSSLVERRLGQPLVFIVASYSQGQLKSKIYGSFILCKTLIKLDFSFNSNNLFAIR